MADHISNSVDIFPRNQPNNHTLVAKYNTGGMEMEGQITQNGERLQLNIRSPANQMQFIEWVDDIDNINVQDYDIIYYSDMAAVVYDPNLIPESSRALLSLAALGAVVMRRRR